MNVIHEAVILRLETTFHLGVLVLGSDPFTEKLVNLLLESCHPRTLLSRTGTLKK
jgi:hypothetical protein